MRVYENRAQGWAKMRAKEGPMQKTSNTRIEIRTNMQRRMFHSRRTKDSMRESGTVRGVVGAYENYERKASWVEWSRWVPTTQLNGRLKVHIPRRRVGYRSRSRHTETDRGSRHFSITRLTHRAIACRWSSLFLQWRRLGTRRRRRRMLLVLGLYLIANWIEVRVPEFSTQTFASWDDGYLAWQKTRGASPPLSREVWGACFDGWKSFACTKEQSIDFLLIQFSTIKLVC